MSTTSDRLALLQRTKAGQRALLEGMYPDLDFSTVPFREYGRLFTGRKYVPGFVGGWKTYGRSNSEDPATRDILPDYSGNGRDIRLYNFAFSGMSGYYSGIPFNFSNFQEIVGTDYQSGITSIEGDTIRIHGAFTEPAYRAGVKTTLANQEIHLQAMLKVTGLKEGQSISFQDYTGTSLYGRTMRADGILYLEYTTGTGGTGAVYIIVVSENPEDPVDVTIEQLPAYTGGLVSDGIDDYGQCIKGFALPDDYTIVAIRRIIEGHAAAFASKGSTAGAFLFEVLNNTNKSGVVWSYGQTNSLTNAPDLFSYQSKASYNGQEILYGTAEDSIDDAFTIFRYSAANHMLAVLYDLRIYDHSLSAEELQIVKDEMMSDYEKATGGGIADIHYVADWDGKGRSNDEDEPMRSTWTDRATGKVIDLHNYAYAGMSGWNGYSVDFSSLIAINDNSVIDGNKIYLIKAQPNTGNVLKFFTPGEKIQMTVKVTGLTEYVNSGTIERLTFYTNDSAYRFVCLQDGVYDINFTATSSDQRFYIWAKSLAGDDFNLSPNIVIEQLPLYPGALVSDGIDDYGLTQEAINEEVGTMLAMLKVANDIKLGSYFLNCGKNDNANRLYCWIPSDGIPKMGLPSRNITLPMCVLTRTPASPSEVMYIATYSGGFPSKKALYRIILIQEQLDGAQVEFLKWKVDKEYRDWCRDNGYEYAINQLTA